MKIGFVENDKVNYIECISDDNGFAWKTDDKPNQEWNVKAECNFDKLSDLDFLTIENPNFNVKFELKAIKVKGKQYARPFLWKQLIDFGTCEMVNNIINENDETNKTFSISFNSNELPL